MRRPPSNRPAPARWRSSPRLRAFRWAEIEPLSRGPLNRTEVRFRRLVFPGQGIGLPEHTPRLVCPACLTEAAYHRAIWDFIFTSACPIHSRALLDTCRSCGKPLWWAGTDVSHCGRCLGGDLTKMPTADVPEANLRGLRVIYGLFKEPGFEADADRARGVRRSETSAMARSPYSSIGRGFSGSVAATSRSASRRAATASQAHLALAEGLALAESWPTHSTTSSTRCVAAILAWLRARGLGDQPGLWSAGWTGSRPARAAPSGRRAGRIGSASSGNG